MSTAKWKCAGCGHIPHAVCFGLMSDGSICRCDGQPEHDVVCEHGGAADVDCPGCHSGFIFEQVAAPAAPKDDPCARCRAEKPTTTLELTTLYPPGPRGGRWVSSGTTQALCSECMIALNQWLAPKADPPAEGPPRMQCGEKGTAYRGLFCELPHGHAENHKGSSGNVTAQWPPSPSPAPTTLAPLLTMSKLFHENAEAETDRYTRGCIYEIEAQRAALAAKEAQVIHWRSEYKTLETEIQTTLVDQLAAERNARQEAEQRISDPPLNARSLFDFMDAAHHLDCSVGDELVRLCGYDLNDPATWPMKDITFDSYDSSFEFRSVTPGWEMTAAQWEACATLGFMRAWVVYTDGTERYYPGGHFKSETHVKTNLTRKHDLKAAEQREARLREDMRALVLAIYEVSGDPDNREDCGDIEERPCQLHESAKFFAAVLAAEAALGPCSRCGHTRPQHHDEDTARCKECRCEAFRLAAALTPPAS